MDEVIRVTKLSFGNKSSIRTAIPNELIKEYGLKAGDHIIWKKRVSIENSNKVVYVIIEFQHQ